MIVILNGNLDDNITELRMRHGMVGYGAYAYLLDMLVRSGNCLPCNYKSLAYEMHIDQDGADIVRSVVEDFGLFILTDGQFASAEVKAALKSQKAKRSAEARWNKQPKCEDAPTIAETASIVDKKVESNQLSLPFGEEPNTAISADEANDDNLADQEQKPRKKFVKPTIEEVAAFCKQENINNVDPETFWHSYESKGWMIGKNKMQKWRSAVKMWARSNYGNNQQKPIAESRHGPAIFIPPNQHFEDF